MAEASSRELGIESGEEARKLPNPDTNTWSMGTVVCVFCVLCVLRLGVLGVCMWVCVC